MKRKYHGLISLAVVLIAVGLGALYSRFASQQAAPLAKIKPPHQSFSLSIPDVGMVRQMGRLEKRLGRLAGLVSVPTTPVDLWLFGHGEAQHAGLRWRRAPDATGQLVIDYEVSLAFVARTQQFCIIDGVFYSPGSLLPDQAKVLQIAADRVLIEKQGRQAWVAVATAPPQLTRNAEAQTESRSK